MSNSDDKKDKPGPKPGVFSGAGRSGSARSIGEELGELDFEPDALLDSLLSDDDAPKPEPKPAAEPGASVADQEASTPPPGPPVLKPDARMFSEDEVTQVGSVEEVEQRRRRPSAEVDALLDEIGGDPPPVAAAPARPAPPAARPAAPAPPRPPALQRPAPPRPPPPRPAAPTRPAAPEADVDALDFGPDDLDLDELQITAAAPLMESSTTAAPLDPAAAPSAFATDDDDDIVDEELGAEEFAEIATPQPDVAVPEAPTATESASQVTESAPLTTEPAPPPSAGSEIDALLADDSVDPTRIVQGGVVPQDVPATGPSLPAPYFDDDAAELSETGTWGTGTFTIDAERPAAAHLTAQNALDHWRRRAEWLELEARARPDPQSKSRALVVASELWAMVGDTSRARATATEAAAASASAVATRQTRALAAVEHDYKAVAVALEAEARSAQAPEVRDHAHYLAAEVHRLTLNDTATATRKIEALARTGDVRGNVAKLGALLAASSAAPKLKLPDDPQLEGLRRATSELARLRGDDVVVTDAGEAVRFEEARRALNAGQRERAGQELAALASSDGLEEPVRWLAAALLAHGKETRAAAIDLVRGVLDSAEGRRARRVLAARALEQNDAEAVAAALEADGDEPAFSPGDRVALAALTGGGRDALQPLLPALADDPRMAPLAAAARAAAAPPSAPAEPGAGSPHSRVAIALGRAAIAAGAGDADPTLLPAAIKALAESQPDHPLARVLVMELANRAGDTATVAARLAGWPTHDTPERGRDRHLAAALLYELAGDADEAAREYSSALAADAGHEAATRALASHSPPDGAAELIASLAASNSDAAASGLFLLEAALRASEPALRDVYLRRAVEACPELPFGHALLERAAREAGDAQRLVETLRARRAAADDAVEAALDATREALLIADTDLAEAASLLNDAVTARPGDVALRELFERLGSGSPEEAGAWREEVAESASEADRGPLLFDACVAFERAGAVERAAAAAQRAAAAGSAIGAVAAERLAPHGPGAADLSERLLSEARATEDASVQCELYERLGRLDRARGDIASAVLWDSAILEASPNHLPSLRRLEHAYLGGGRRDELEPVAAALATALDGDEAGAHAWLAARLRRLAGNVEGEREMIAVAAKLDPAPLWALRALAVSGDDGSELAACAELRERASRGIDAATLSLRAAEAARRLGDAERAAHLVERTVELLPDHPVALALHAEVLQRTGDLSGAAEALEALAASSMIDAHRVEALSTAAALWIDRVEDQDRGLAALERAADIDLTYGDVFERLRAQYVARDDRQKLASLLERRLDQTDDPEERVALEVTRGRALAEVGDREAAKQALAAALDANPDHVDALDAFAELCAAEQDWEGAEQAWIRLARTATDPERQVQIYRRLGELYDGELANPARAELAYKEILKRHPNDVATQERLVFVYGRLGDTARAVDLQNDLLEKSGSPEEKRDRTLALARVYEELAGDKRKAETTLDRARKTWPQDGIVLRALAQFYQRHGENTALNVLLDRAANDARRALSTGRFDPGLFAALATVAELRGGTDAAEVANATLAALEGSEATLSGAGAAAADPRLDELLAPDLLTLPLRALLKKSGDALDAAYPVDMRSLKAVPLPTESGPLVAQLQQVATRFGIHGLEVYSSPSLGTACLPASTLPPRIVFGTDLLESADAALRDFLIIRALKIVQASACALARTAPIDLWPVVAGYLAVFATNWQPPNVDAKKFAEAHQKIRAALTRRLDDDVPVLALEVIGSIGNRASQLGTAINQWGNRTALLAVGSPTVALRSVALASGHGEEPPTEGVERMKWIVRHPEARDLAVFSVSEQYSEARRRVGLAGG